MSMTIAERFEVELAHVRLASSANFCGKYVDMRNVSRCMFTCFIDGATNGALSNIRLVQATSITGTAAKVFTPDFAFTAGANIVANYTTPSAAGSQYVPTTLVDVAQLYAELHPQDLDRANGFFYAALAGTSAATSNITIVNIKELLVTQRDSATAYATVLDAGTAVVGRTGSPFA